MRETVYPGLDWERISAKDAGFNPQKLAKIEYWLTETAKSMGKKQHRTVIVRGGRVVAEWNVGLKAQDRVNLASASKSFLSSLLGIAVADGVIPSAEARLIDFYPEALDVPEGAGPKPGRYVFEANKEITLKQLISNTSGYMKPGESPGQVFHYQTYGMNVLSHAIAKAYGYYDPADPFYSLNMEKLYDDRLRIPISTTWAYRYQNFRLHPQARLDIFGFGTMVWSTALDMARLGWLWLNEGKWEDNQVIPADWLREATKTAPDIKANAAPEDWKYGYGFWTNQYAKLWPNLPADSFAASGAGSQHIWVCPSLDLVVVQSPGLWQDQAENDTGLLRLVVDACS